MLIKYSSTGFVEADVLKKSILCEAVIHPSTLSDPYPLLNNSLYRFRVDPIPYDTPKPAGHTRFVCVSDTHSRTDGIQMPYGDVLLHMGDFTELGLPSEVKKFNDWLGTELLHTHAHWHALVFNGWRHETCGTNNHYGPHIDT